MTLPGHGWSLSWLNKTITAWQDFLSVATALLGEVRDHRDHEGSNNLQPLIVKLTFTFSQERRSFAKYLHLKLVLLSCTAKHLFFVPEGKSVELHLLAEPD